MPCYSSIRTKMTNGERLQEALRVLGYQVTSNSNLVTGTRGTDRLTFIYANGAYEVSSSTDQNKLAELSRKYAEIGVRQWANRRGYSIVENDGKRLVLQERRSK